MTETPRAWRVVLEKIEQDLLDGRLGPGDRLAPERELATTLGVGRSSVREALRVLEVMGLIRTGTGSGPTSGAIIISTPQGGLASLLRLQVAAQGFELSDVVETRLILEAWSVTHLAEASDADLAEARVTLDAMRAPGLTPEEFLALDAQFHLRLSEAAGNTIVAATMAGLRSSIEAYVQRGAEAVEDWPAMVATLVAEHDGILDAIEAGDPDLARTRVHAHISGYYAATGLSRI
ncbi:FadR/GntR family transcriptional regulator [Microbacterium terricola]|uniref:GntR family transcriptional regulator n=1 Tax=Microbacterium terricola TaxID=344163 RepID=A0ABM8E0B9_9MICO|nr:FadR/GntR family transcriptional regulator [Microbacterium terricola]UYK40876.1 FadR family transcriptional regulator [Microbacterium terricola]BDV31374.1 GntR family transcriptional regulator [Microbacterium terricola]